MSEEEYLCFICHESDKHLLSMDACCGCLCKGSIKVHEDCLEEWIVVQKSLDCSICHISYSVSKLSSFISHDRLLYVFLGKPIRSMCYLLLNHIMIFPIFFDDFKVKFYSPTHHDFYMKIINSLNCSETFIIRRMMLHVIMSLENFTFNFYLNVFKD